MAHKSVYSMIHCVYTLCIINYVDKNLNLNIYMGTTEDALKSIRYYK